MDSGANEKREGKNDQRKKGCLSTHTPLRLCLLLSAALLCVGSFALASAQTRDQNELAKRLGAGVEEAREGNFSVATADLEAAVSLGPNNPEAWYQLGLLRGQVADFPGAESAFRRAIKLKPDFAEVHYSLGLTLIANPRGKLDWPGAIAEFREALKSRPDYAEALNLLGAGLTNTGEVEAAIPVLQRAVQLKPSLPDAHFNLAIAYEKSNHLDEAETEYSATITAKNDYPEALTALGKLLYRLGKVSEAEHELNKAATLNPDMTDAHYTLARVLQSQNKTAQAGIEFQIAKELSERPANAMQSSQLSNQGLELAAKGDFPGALETIRKAIELKPDYGIPHYNLALILADTGDLNGAAKELAKAISLLPGQSKPWFQLGRVLRSQGNNQSAFEAISWAARLSPGDAAIQAELASLDSSLKPADSPVSSKLLIATTDPPHVGAVSDTPEDHVAFAEQLIAQSDFQGAVGELLRVLSLQPAADVPRHKLANAYETMGNTHLAMIEYYKILLGHPQDVESRVDLGRILLNQGDPQAAAEEFRIALRYQPDASSARLGLEKALKTMPNH